MKVLTLSLCVLLSSSVFGNQGRKPFDASELKEKVDQLVPDPAIIVWNYLPRSIAWVDDSTFYFNPEGTLHLFKVGIHDTLSVEKLSKSIYHGSSFSRGFFIKNEIPYQYSGKGLFTSFNGLLKFDLNAKEWYEIKIKNFPRIYGTTMGYWRYKNGLLVTHGLLNDSTKLAYGFIDLDDFSYTEYSRFKHDLRDHLISSRNTIDRYEKFEILASPFVKNCHYHLLDRETGIIVTPSFLQNRENWDGLNAVSVKDSMMYYRSSNGSLDSLHLRESTIILTQDIPKHFEKKIKSQSRKSNTPLNMVVVAFMVVIVGFVGWMYYQKKKSTLPQKSKASDIEELEYEYAKELSTLENKLLANKGKQLSRDEFDSLLSITSDNSDLTKANRSRMIQEINSNGVVNINRIRNPKDRRVFLYFIEETESFKTLASNE